MMIANPTAASAAATTITKKTKICPLSGIMLVPSATRMRVPVIGKRHKAQVHRVEHELNRHKDGDDVALEQKAEHAQRKQDAAQDEIPGKWDHLVLPLSQHHRAHNGDENQH